MKSSKCEKIMDAFLQLDKNERLPFSITWHLFRCKKCRTQVRLCSMAEKAAARPLNATLPLNNESFDAIMAKINSSENKKVVKKARKVSMKSWILGGIVLLAALICYGFQKNPSAQSMNFFLLLAVALIGYCALFIGSNLDFFVKKFVTTGPKAGA